MKNIGFIIFLLVITGNCSWAQKLEFISNGQKVVAHRYERDQAGAVTYFDSLGAVLITEVIPRFNFEGGIDRFIGMNVKYPAQALRANVGGEVLVQFIITTEGKVEELKVISSVHPSLSSEALRVVKLSNGGWIPATHNGQPVPYTYVHPVRFRIMASPSRW